MPNTITKVLYKPDSQSVEEYSVAINPEQYSKWKNGDTSIPLALVVESFDVFVSQGATGLMNKPSNQQLENIFGTSKDVDVVEYILKNGREQTTTLQPDKWGNTNDSRGSLGDPSGR